MGKNGNLILNATMSKLISERDDVLVQLDLTLNKNISNKGVSGIVNQSVNIFKELSQIEGTIETLRAVIESNSLFNQQISEITDSIKNLQQKNTENNGSST